MHLEKRRPAYSVRYIRPFKMWQMPVWLEALWSSVFAPIQASPTNGSDHKNNRPLQRTYVFFHKRSFKVLQVLWTLHADIFIKWRKEIQQLLSTQTKSNKIQTGKNDTDAFGINKWKKKQKNCFFARWCKPFKNYFYFILFIFVFRTKRVSIFLVPFSCDRKIPGHNG